MSVKQLFPGSPDSHCHSESLWHSNWSERLKQHQLVGAPGFFSGLPTLVSHWWHRPRSGWLGPRCKAHPPFPSVIHPPAFITSSPSGSCPGTMGMAKHTVPDTWGMTSTTLCGPINSQPRQGGYPPCWASQGLLSGVEGTTGLWEAGFVISGGCGALVLVGGCDWLVWIIL